MPIRRFWLLSRNLDRYLAELDIRRLTVCTAANASSGDAIKETNQRLILEVGKVIEEKMPEPVLDRAGLARLKAMK